MEHESRPRAGRPSRPELDRRSVAGPVVAVAIIVVVLLVLAFWLLNDLLVDRLWFESVGQLPVWDLRTFGRLLLWIPVTLIAFLLLTLSVWIAIRSAGDPV